MKGAMGMRLRKHYKNYKGSGERDDGTSKKTQTDGTDEEVKNVKEARPFKASNIIKDIMSNPNLNMQIMVILLSLTSDNMRMDKRIDGITTTIDKVRNITELVNNGVQSMKVAAEVPKSIRRLLE